MSGWLSVPLFGSMDGADIFVCVMMALQALVSPFTKVEESFNIQALHDLAYHETNISAYDHLEFPGVVPRSFLGPLIVQLFLLPISSLQNLMYQSGPKIAGQIKVRLGLGILVLIALRRYRGAVAQVFGKASGRWTMLITASQFHFTFYMSRPLPNTFALIFVLLAMQMWLERRLPVMIWLAAVVGLVFRAELVLFLAPMLVIEYTRRPQRMSTYKFVKKVLRHTIPAGVIVLVTTVLVDSYFWQRWLWPEGAVFFFNAILNKSSQYGTSPYLWYIYSVIPRCMLTSLVFIPEALRVDMRTRLFAAPVAVFILLFSILPHKELRFVIYVVPLLNTVAAVACARLWQRRKTRLQQLLGWVCVAHLFVNLVLCSVLMYISHHNYPGGHAMRKLHQLEPADKAVNVHLSNYACQTGVTRYTQLNDNWIYNKTEHLPAGGDELMNFTHLIVEVSTPNMTELKPYERTHKRLEFIDAFSRLQFSGLQGLLRLSPVEVILEPKLVILKKVVE